MVFLAENSGSVCDLNFNRELNPKCHIGSSQLGTVPLLPLATFPPHWGHLAMSADALGCHKWGAGEASGI